MLYGLPSIFLGNLYCLTFIFGFHGFLVSIKIMFDRPHLSGVKLHLYGRQANFL